MKDGMTILEGILWVMAWFGFMLLYTFLDVAVWRKLAPAHSRTLNLLSITACMGVFLSLLVSKGHFRMDFPGKTALPNLLLAAGCAGALYLLLDRCLDPVFEGFFPQSEDSYQETLQSLRSAPVTSLLQICVLAPVIEEILMRGVLLGGLSVTYGRGIALAVSSLLFALFHFNMVQTLSALVCGLMLGLLYLHTDSLLCCMIAHMGYNFISFIGIMRT